MARACDRVHGGDLRLFGLFASAAVAGYVGDDLRRALAARCNADAAGIIGIVLTIGIAVDSNVLIYERIREEVRTAAARSRRSTRASRGRLRPSSIPTSRPSLRPLCCFSSALARSAFRGDARHRDHHDHLHRITLTRLMSPGGSGGCAPQQLAIS